MIIECPLPNPYNTLYNTANTANGALCAMYIVLLLLNVGHIQIETCCSFNKTDIVFKLCAKLIVPFQGVISGTQWTMDYIKTISYTTCSSSPFNAKWCASELVRNKKYPKFGFCMAMSLFNASPCVRDVDSRGARVRDVWYRKDLPHFIRAPQFFLKSADHFGHVPED